MRKRGDVLEQLALNKGLVREEPLRHAQFAKCAMIERVMHNINERALKDSGSPAWGVQEYNKKFKSASASISVFDLLAAPTMHRKVGLILKELTL